MTGAPFYIFWSPDGSGIGVLHNSPVGTIDFELVDVAEGTSEVVAQGSPFYFSWSPDSTQVAAHVQGSFLGTIDRAGDGSDLGQTAAGYQAPHWVPDGIIHLADEGLELRQPDGEDRVVATVTGPVSFVANPRGTLVAIQVFVDEEETPPGVDVALRETPALSGNEVLVLDLATGDTTRVVDSLSLGMFWSPDGRSLLVLVPAEGGEFELDVLMWREEGVTELSRLSPHPSLVSDVLRFFDQYGQSLRLWSPDSAAFALPGAIDDEPGIWVYLIAGEEPVKVADGSWVAWSGV
jgi:TolB protein